MILSSKFLNQDKYSFKFLGCKLSEANFHLFHEYFEFLSNVESIALVLSEITSEIIDVYTDESLMKINGLSKSSLSIKKVIVSFKT